MPTKNGSKWFKMVYAPALFPAAFLNPDPQAKPRPNVRRWRWPGDGIGNGPDVALTMARMWQKPSLHSGISSDVITETQAKPN
jgi:hypothetical protein